MKNIRTLFLLLALVASISTTAHAASLLDQLGGLAKSPTSTNSSGTSILPASLSQDQIIAGLKEALGKGVNNAIANLGHSGGFLTNLNVKIPMPDKLRTVEKTLRSLKQDKYADDFVNSMNHAAEQAVPEAAAVFGDAIKLMSITDAKNILTGTNNAATEYFRRTTQTNLFARFHPIVQKATSAVGVTSYYKKMLDKVNAGSGTTLGSLGSLANSSGLVKTQDMDVDKYVTEKALDGLFKMVADEEKAIRQNPLARTTDLLKSVFGAVTK